MTQDVKPANSSALLVVIMRSWYSARELAGLPGMPGTERAIQIRAKREHWEGQSRLGSKAIEYAFAILPMETQTALISASVPEE